MATKGTLRQYYTQGADLIYLIKSNNPDIALFSTVFEWEIKSQDIVNNKSTISWSYKIETLDLSRLVTYISGVVADSMLIGVTNSSSYTDVKVNIAGKTQYEPTNYSLSVTSNNTYTLASGEYEAAHKADGTVALDIYTHIRVKNFYDGSKACFNEINETCDYSGSIALDAIPRHAVILSAPNFTDEDSPTITFAIPSGATNVRAYIAFSTSTIDIGPYAVSGSSYTFNFDEAEKKKLWSILDQGLESKQVHFYVMSDYQGTTYYSPLTRTLTVINYTPIINSNVNEIYDTNEKSKLLTGDKYKLIRYVSNAYYNIGAEGRKGAEIESASIKNGTLTKYSSTGTFEGVTSPIFEYTATDSRGNSIPLTKTDVSTRAGYWIPYVKLTCSSSATEMTADGDVDITLRGKFFNGNFSASKRNRLRMHYDTVKDGEELGMTDMGYIDFSDSRGNYSYNSTTSEFTYTFTIPNLNYMSVYEITVRVSDEVAVQGTETQLILASEPIFDWGRTDFNFNVPVNINGDLTVEGTIKAGGKTVPTIQAQGTAGIWTYRTWSDGTAECWGKKDVSVTFPSSANWGGLYTTGAISGSNVSFPFGLFAETPVVNASLLIRSAGGILMAPGGTGSNIASMDQTGVYEIARGTYVSGSQAYTINYQVRGRWK